MHRQPLLTLLLGVAGAALALPSIAAPGCSARAEAAPTVVELYTSEGCSSCPPADRWLSTLKAGPGLVALAFHVNYWDKLGWPDRFASSEYTERQRQMVQPSGSRYAYTPQVIVDGHDWRGWPKLPPRRAAAVLPAVPTLTLVRDGDTVTAQVGSASGALSGYWALVEDGHVSNVRAGENAGETLRHDHVVRRYEALADWAGTRARQFQWRAPAASGPNPRRVVLVVTDAASKRPLQALALGC